MQLPISLPAELVYRKAGLAGLHQALAEAITRLVQRRRDERQPAGSGERCRCAGK